MSISTTKVNEEFTGNGSNDTFAFSGISFLEGTAEDVFDVYIDDVLESEANWSITEDSATEGISTGGDLIFTTAPANDATIEIRRNTDKTQPTVFGAAYTKESIRNSADRLLLQLQEVLFLQDLIEAGGGGASSTVSTIADWETATAYILNQVILYEDTISKRFYRCIEAHTSGTFVTDLLANKWEEIEIIGRKGDDGAKGAKGDTGATGAKGDQGDAGAAGADGIFSAIATQGEAQAGTDNTKGMSPLRVKESIATELADYYTQTQIDTKNNSQDNEISLLKQRASALENGSSVNLYSGQQRLQNNLAVAEDLLGRDADVAELGAGDAFSIDEDGANFARFEVLIQRQDDLETRLVSVTLIMHYIGGTWYLGREATIVLNDGNPDGITFDVSTTGGVGTVNYTSDNMAGGNYTGTITWRGVEISKPLNG